ncbi:hypothetical protein CDL12_24039 [Handroanthus impetiginosus]|uniref:CCT domain-containing protein n=1 Tax=Handroanthus impetiginosus TaxID=429701 RepID=A0A2G9GDT3_9LAMI|nr:hypothetical protein CDL12_24039 [Handroanthus impetiginosus]
MPKKPKFRSLRLQFPPEETKISRRSSKMRHSSTSSSAAAASATNSHQLNLFPLHPENQVEDREIHEQENVAYFFSAADGCGATLTGLLDTAVATVCNSPTTTDSSRPDDLSPSASLTYAYRREDSEKKAALERNALKSRERDSSEEKWVCYSEVVERKLKEEEVTSSAVDLRRGTNDRAGIQRLSLKLDYEEILNAWSDKGPLYIHAENSQIVPDITDDFLFHEGVNKGCNLGSWAVPEIENDEMRLKMWQREASVLRYKAKRNNRLFSNKIRYQVRKLNAEKRPRLKGRFVKRS